MASANTIIVVVCFILNAWMLLFVEKKIELIENHDAATAQYSE